MKHNERELKIIAERKKFIELLRSFPEERHGCDAFSTERDGEVVTYCAIGLYLYEGEHAKDRRRVWHMGDEEGFAMSRLGISMEAYIDITEDWNDHRKLSFAEIADKFEEANFPIDCNAGAE